MLTSSIPAVRPYGSIDGYALLCTSFSYANFKIIILTEQRESSIMIRLTQITALKLAKKHNTIWIVSKYQHTNIALRIPSKNASTRFGYSFSSFKKLLICDVEVKAFFKFRTEYSSKRFKKQFYKLIVPIISSRKIFKKLLNTIRKPSYFS